MSAEAGVATGAREPGPAPGDVLLHPSPLLAAAAIAFNDFVLRPRAPGWLSGKLSDAGLCFLLPFLVVAALEWAAWLRCALHRRPFVAARPAAILFASLVSAAYFIGQELVPAFGRFHAAWVETLLPGRHVVLTRDPTDLACLALTVAAYLALRSLRAPSAR